MSPKILTTIKNETAIITLNHPQKHNVLDLEMIHELSTAYCVFEEDSSIRTIFLHTLGKHFCVGADLNHMIKMSEAPFEENVKDAKTLTDLFYRIYNNKKITVCLSQGKTMGGGIGLLSANDFTLCTKSAEFCFPEVKLGLIPATISPFVLHRMDYQTAKYHMICAEIFNAKKAHQSQLIDIILDTSTPSEAIELSIDFINKRHQNNEQAMQATKTWLNQLHPITKNTLDDAALLLAKTRASELVKKKLKNIMEKDIRFSH